MTDLMIKEAIARTLGVDYQSIVVEPRTVTVRCHRSTTVTYTELQKLTEYLHTTAIDFSFSPESEGYGEMTPGDPAEFEITIYRSPAEIG